MNQPFSNNFSMEEGGKKHGAGRTVNHAKMFLRRSKKRGRKTIQSQHYESHSFRAGQIFSGSPQRKSFSIIRDKVFKPANGEALDASLKDYFYKAQASNFQRRP